MRADRRCDMKCTCPQPSARLRTYLVVLCLHRHMVTTCLPILGSVGVVDRFSGVRPSIPIQRARIRAIHSHPSTFHPSPSAVPFSSGGFAAPAVPRTKRGVAVAGTHTWRREVDYILLY